MNCSQYTALEGLHQACTVALCCLLASALNSTQRHSSLPCALASHQWPSARVCAIHTLPTLRPPGRHKQLETPEGKVPKELPGAALCTYARILSRPAKAVLQTPPCILHHKCQTVKTSKEGAADDGQIRGTGKALHDSPSQPHTPIRHHTQHNHALHMNLSSPSTPQSCIPLQWTLCPAPCIPPPTRHANMSHGSQAAHLHLLISCQQLGIPPDYVHHAVRSI